MRHTFWSGLFRLVQPLRRPLRKELLRFLTSTESASATPFDVYFAHRLLARRQPTPDEWKRWEAEAEAGRLDPDELVARIADPLAPLVRELKLDGYSLFVDRRDPLVGAPLAATLKHEPHVTAHFRQAIQPDSVVLDVGANMGWFTLLAAHLAPRGRIIAVEAHLGNVRLIDQSKAANGFSHVEIWPIAASERSELLTFAAPNSNGFVTAADDLHPSNARRVPAFALDELLRDADRLDLVKIDIEGFEPYAVRGFVEALSRFRPVVFTEFHPWIMRSREPDLADRYLRFWRDLGYALAIIEASGELREDQSDSQIWAHWSDLNARAGSAAGVHHLDLIAQPRERGA